MDALACLEDLGHRTNLQLERGRGDLLAAEEALLLRDGAQVAAHLGGDGVVALQARIILELDLQGLRPAAHADVDELVAELLQRRFGLLLVPADLLLPPGGSRLTEEVPVLLQDVPYASLALPHRASRKSFRLRLFGLGLPALGQLGGGREGVPRGRRRPLELRVAALVLVVEKPGLRPGLLLCPTSWQLVLDLSELALSRLHRLALHLATIGYNSIKQRLARLSANRL
mmetsp:Transcript_43698/g.132276  ORF Transcript_43698/g.132276 Transcript_43698/m.132276 type:complete len:229 (+) Transcript_43698:161-847(+)